jgi:hypothetical protein
VSEVPDNWLQRWFDRYQRRMEHRARIAHTLWLEATGDAGRIRDRARFILSVAGVIGLLVAAPVGWFTWWAATR